VLRFSLETAWQKTLTPIKMSALLAMPGNPALLWAMDSLAAVGEAAAAYRLLPFRRFCWLDATCAGADALGAMGAQHAAVL
jgi:hypothetical protein